MAAYVLGFQNGNASVLQMYTEEQFFLYRKNCFWKCPSFWPARTGSKPSIEYENQQYQRLGSVVANQGYSDWATTDIDASIREIWYRLSRRGQDFCLECSRDGENFYQMRNCHLAAASGEISLGLYACSPENSLFRAGITQMQVTECLWQGHG